MAISDVVKQHNVKCKAVGIAAAGITLGSAFLPGCSSGSYVDYSAISSMENELYKLVREQPQISGVKYSPSSSRILEAQFTIGDIVYLLSWPYTAENETPKALLVASDDGKKLVATTDSGSGNQIYSGTLDGKVDSGRIKEQGKDEQIYNVYTGQNTGLREDLQKAHNSSLEKILKFFKQQ